MAPCLGVGESVRELPGKSRRSYPSGRRADRSERVFDCALCRVWPLRPCGKLFGRECAEVLAIRFGFRRLRNNPSLEEGPFVRWGGPLISTGRDKGNSATEDRTVMECVCKVEWRRGHDQPRVPVRVEAALQRVSRPAFYWRRRLDVCVVGRWRRSAAQRT